MALLNQDPLPAPRRSPLVRCFELRRKLIGSIGGIFEMRLGLRETTV